MSSVLLRFLKCLLVGIVIVLALPGRAVGSEPDLDDFAKQLGAQITNAGVKSAAVADFLTEGTPSEQGWYLANRLSENWLQHPPEFRIADRSQLGNTKLSAADLDSKEILKRMGGLWGVEAIVCGTIQASSDGFLLATDVRRVADGATVATASVRVAHSPVLDLLDSNWLDADGALPSRSGVQGAGVPVCVYCPTPQYSDRARKNGIQATIVLTVVVSADGRAVRVRVTKDPGYGLAEHAIEAVGMWKFRPAANKDGKPIPVIVPIEITFRVSPS
jgi:TonB family protein